MTPGERLRRSFDVLGVAQVVTCDYDDTGDQIRMLIRVNKGDDRLWLYVIDAILVEEERLEDEVQEEYEAELVEYEEDESLEDPPQRQSTAWNVHICKHYMRHEGRLLFGWNVTLQANGDIRGAVFDLNRLLSMMSRHIDVLRDEMKRQRANNVVPLTSRGTQQVQQVIVESQVPGAGSGGRMENGEVVEMPLIGVTVARNQPQAPMLTPGVRGRGRTSGLSSKGAHPIR
jgi:hypothetical protein